MILKKLFRFEASHRLPFHGGKCARLHGHSWVLEVELEGPLDPSTGFVVDFADIKSAVQPVIDELDHRHLGTWEELSVEHLMQWGVHWLPINFNATCENLLFEIGMRLPADFRWSKLSLQETCTSEASMTKAEFVKLAAQRGV